MKLNPETKIKFDIPLFGSDKGSLPLVQIGIFDILGRQVAVLLNKQLSPGSYEISFDASDYPSGVYFYKLEAGEFKSSILHLKRATEVDPNHADAFYDLGKAILLQGDADSAIPLLRRAIELKPSDPSPHYQLARALQKFGKEEESRQELQTFTALRKAQPVTGGMASEPIQ